MGEKKEAVREPNTVLRSLPKAKKKSRRVRRSSLDIGDRSWQFQHQSSLQQAGVKMSKGGIMRPSSDTCKIKRRGSLGSQLPVDDALQARRARSFQRPSTHDSESSNSKQKLSETLPARIEEPVEPSSG